MNTHLHMVAYALNFKWHTPRPGQIHSFDDDEVMEGLMKALHEMYSNEEATIL